MPALAFSISFDLFHRAHLLISKLLQRRMAKSFERSDGLLALYELRATSAVFPIICNNFAVACFSNRMIWKDSYQQLFLIRKIRSCGAITHSMDLQAAEFFTYENYLAKVSNLLKLNHQEAIRSSANCLIKMELLSGSSQSYSQESFRCD